MKALLELSEENIYAIAEKVVEIQDKKKLSEKKPPTEEQQYTVNEVADMTKQSAQTVRIHINSGILMASRIGRSWKISESNYKTYINNGQ